jgi:hypothetical protein
MGKWHGREECRKSRQERRGRKWWEIWERNKGKYRDWYKGKTGKGYKQAQAGAKKEAVL